MAIKHGSISITTPKQGSITLTTVKHGGITVFTSGATTYNISYTNSGLSSAGSCTIAGASSYTSSTSSQIVNLGTYTGTGSTSSYTFTFTATCSNTTINNNILINSISLKKWEVTCTIPANFTGDFTIVWKITRTSSCGIRDTCATTFIIPPCSVTDSCSVSDICGAKDTVCTKKDIL